MKIQLIALVFSALFLGCNTMPFIKYHTTFKDGKFPKADAKYISKANDIHWVGYDVNYYDLKLDVNPDKKFIDGSMTIRFKANEDIDNILVDLHRDLKVNKIVYNQSKEVKWKHKKDVLTVLLNEKAKINLMSELEIFYSGKPPKLLDKGPVHWKKDSLDNHWVTSITQGIGAHWIIPCKYDLEDEADSTKISITVPQGLVAVSNGQLVAQRVSSGKETFEWKVTNSINVYNLSFNVGKFKHLELPYESGGKSQKLHFYVLDYHYKKAQTYFNQCKDILQYFEGLYGPYPYWNDEFKIVESPLPKGVGMEHQSAIVVGLSYKNTFVDYSSVLIHEIAHEWWGNSLSVTDYGDIWLHEGFATYNEALFMEHMYGKDMYFKILNFQKRGIHNQRPILKPSGVNYNSFVSSKDGDIYSKGSMLLHTLRYQMSDDALFFDMLASFYKKNQYKGVRTNDFLAHVNAYTGSDYTWLFDPYLKNYKIPELYYKIDNKNNNRNKVSLNYKWVGVGNEFKLDLNVIHNSDTLRLRPTTSLQSIELKDNNTVEFDRNNGYVNFVNGTL
ncbi:M1 family metallopeptidase [Fulvivirga sp. 29W222]|uniref:Aminopeptidase N n=1 Tax=Fulvivirga marina TaxID=2494733 RepID=A0A937KE93_9BACT|nr:M1 family metallopeptidase [Fulvivirga marina]MBL6449329.1 M1 family metallopeptidase [Fulvivirga marina]